MEFVAVAASVMTEGLATPRVGWFSDRLLDEDPERLLDLAKHLDGIEAESATLTRVALAAAGRGAGSHEEALSLILVSFERVDARSFLNDAVRVAVADTRAQRAVAIVTRAASVLGRDAAKSPLMETLIGSEFVSNPTGYPSEFAQVCALGWSS